MTETGSPNLVKFDRQTFARLHRVIHDFRLSEVGSRATALAALLIAMLLAINGLNVVNSYVGRNFMTAIERRDRHAFVHQAILYAAVFVGSTMVAVIYRFVEERLGLLWREWLTRRFTARYLDGHLYYWLKAPGGLTNPDQRIADDVRAFTASTLSLALIFVNGTLTVLAFSGVLWSISSTLFLTAVLYAGLGSALAYLVGRPLVRLNYDQSDREADFRAQLVHVRENAESLAMLGYEPRLRARLFDQISALVANLKRIIAVNRNLGFFTTGYGYMIQLIPALIVAPMFIRGSVQFGVIPQSSMAFAQLIGAFSLVVNQFPQLSSYAAVLARLNALGEASDAAEAAGGVSVVEDDSRLACEELTLLAPQDGRLLVRGLSVEVTAASRWLIVASDNLVTGALLLALAGLWHSGSGRVVRPRPHELSILPERPYLPPSTLRAMLVRDSDGQPAPDDRIWDALRQAGADDAARRVGGLDRQLDWNDALSLDEQRLVGVAHLLLSAPRFAVLAHPTASLGAERAADVLTALRDRGLACVVLGDAALGHEQVDVVVEIAADGSWTRQPGP